MFYLLVKNKKKIYEMLLTLRNAVYLLHTLIIMGNYLNLCDVNCV